MNLLSELLKRFTRTAVVKEQQVVRGHGEFVIPTPKPVIQEQVKPRIHSRSPAEDLVFERPDGTFGFVIPRNWRPPGYPFCRTPQDVIAERINHRFFCEELEEKKMRTAAEEERIQQQIDGLQNARLVTRE